MSPAAVADAAWARRARHGLMPADLGGGMTQAAGGTEDGAANRAVDGRAAWATAIAATAILAVSFGAPQLLVVALVPIAEDLGAVRAVPSLAASAAYFGAGLGGIGM